VRTRGLDDAISSSGGWVRGHADAGQRALVADARAAIEQDERDMAALYARTLENRERLATLLPPTRGRHGVVELAGTARIGQMRATTQSEIAVRIVRNFPRVLELMKSGAMYRGTVEMLATLTKNASTEVQVELGYRISDELAPLDAVDARELIVQTLLEVEADLGKQEKEERHERARKNRGLWIKPLGDGMTRIGCDVDDIAAQHFARNLDELVRVQTEADRRTGVERTMQQRRADVLAELPKRQLDLIAAVQRGKDLVPGAESAEDRALALMAIPVKNNTVLNLHFAVSTAAGLDNCPGRIDGAGPIEAGHLRALLPVAKVRRVFVTDTGIPIAMDAQLQPPLAEAESTGGHTRRRARDAGPGRSSSERRQRRRPGSGIPPDRLHELFRGTIHSTAPEPQHDPSAALRRLVHVRDQGCLGVGCSVPGHQCEQDHRVEFGTPGGVTSAANLGDLSPGCHHLKHDGWKLVLNEDGSVTWTSPSGGVYRRTSRWRPPPLYRRSRLQARSSDPSEAATPAPPPGDADSEPTPTTAEGADRSGTADAWGDGRGWNDGPPPF
jgi:hypothetical protein